MPYHIVPSLPHRQPLQDRLNPDLMALPTAPIAPQDLAEAKEATRAADPAVQPTRILWGAYAPAHYTYEVPGSQIFSRDSL